MSNEYCNSCVHGYDLTKVICKECFIGNRYTPFVPLQAPDVSKETKQGLKYDTDKLDWDLLPIESIEEIIKVLMFGAKKYARDNWKNVEPYDIRYYNATLRHLTAWKKGEQTDSETNINHLAHAGTCILFMLWKELSQNKGG